MFIKLEHLLNKIFPKYLIFALCTLLCLLDESCGNFNALDCSKLYVQMFSNSLHEFPPFKNVGDFIYFYNVEIEEYDGR